MWYIVESTTPKKTTQHITTLAERAVEKMIEHRKAQVDHRLFGVNANSSEEAVKLFELGKAEELRLRYGDGLHIHIEKKEKEDESSS